MRVAVLGFGSVWRHRLGRTESRDRFAQPVYYNTTGITVNGNVRQRPQICGYARFDVVGGFDPNHPSKMIGCVFECAEPTVWMGSNRLLFRRILPKHQHPDCFLTDGPTRSRKRRLEISRHLASFLERVRWAAGGSVADVGRPVDPNQAREFRPRAFDNRISDAALGAAR
jgi:hypothetical protein